MPELLDCHWCGSARSIEFGLCQVCLMDYSMDTKVIALPVERVIDLTDRHRIEMPNVTEQRVSGD